MLTFVIPTASYHEAAVEQAVVSCLAQTIRCQVVVVYDHERRGAGWARNRGFEQVATPFVSFLDADDWLEPDFAEKCLLAYDGRHYIYTDWHADRLVEAPCTPWDGRGASHIITTLLPTAFVRYVGGFDETTLAEDSDFYWKLTRAGLCGKRLPEPLFHYGKGGLRAQALYDNPNRDQIMRSIIDRYKGLPMPENCGGCGGAPNPDVPILPANQAFDGAVLATALWAGNRTERGRITGIAYPRTGNGKKLFVHERDIDAAPHLFARVVEMPAPVSDADLHAFRQFTGQVREALGGSARDATQLPAPASIQPGEVKPDVAQVMRLYQQHT